MQSTLPDEHPRMSALIRTMMLTFFYKTKRDAY